MLGRSIRIIIGMLANKICFKVMLKLLFKWLNYELFIAINELEETGRTANIKIAAILQSLVVK